MNIVQQLWTRVEEMRARRLRPWDYPNRLQLVVKGEQEHRECKFDACTGVIKCQRYAKSPPRLDCRWPACPHEPIMNQRRRKRAQDAVAKRIRGAR